MINLSEHMVGRDYKVTLNNNILLEGRCVSYIPAKDNEPEIDSVWIEASNGEITEVFLPTIKQINRII